MKRLFILLALATAALAENPAEPQTRVNRLISLAGSGKIEIDSKLTFKNNADRVAFSIELGIAGGVTGVHSVGGLDGVISLADLNLVTGTNLQAWDADLDAFAGLSGAADKMPYFTGTHTMAITDITSQARTFMAASTIGAQRGALGGSTVGQSLFSLTNPSAKTYLEIQSDNSVITQNAATQLAALGGASLSANQTFTGTNTFGTTNATTANATTLNATTVNATDLNGSLAGCTGLSLTTGVTGILPFVNGGSGSNTQAGLINNAHGALIVTGGLSTTTPTVAGQIGIDTTGSFGIGFGTGANGFATGGVAATNPTWYFHDLNTANAAGIITADQIIATGTTVSTGSHYFGTSNTAATDNVATYQNNNAAKHSAIVFRRSTDPDPGTAAIGMGNSGASAAYANRLNIATNPPSNDINGTTPPINCAWEANDVGGYTSHTALFINPAGKTVTCYGWTLATTVGPVAWDADADGTLAVHTITHTANKVLTVHGDSSLDGTVIQTPVARASGVASYLTVNTPADTGQTAATESIGANFTAGTRTWADGTVALQRERFFGAPTYNKTTTAATFTDVFNAYFDAPISGTGVTFTRPHTVGIVDSTSASSSVTGGLVVSAALGTTATSTGIGGGNINTGGTLTVGGHVTFEGVTSTGATGTGKLVSDTTPTISAPILNGQITGTAYQHAVVTTPQNYSTNSFTNVTGIAFNVVTGHTDSFTIKLSVVGVTGGMQYQFTGPTMTSFAANFDGNTTGAATRSVDRVTALSTANTFATFGTTNVTQMFMNIWGVAVANGTGTVQLQFKPITNGNQVTVNDGSQIQATYEN